MSNWLTSTLTGGSGTANQAVNTVTTTTGTATGPLNPQWQIPSQQLGGLGGGYYPSTGYMNAYPQVSIPTLPIKLGMKELIKLAQVMDTDEDLKRIIQKFSPFIGVDV